MKFIKIIYNPVSGRGAAEDRVNHVAHILLDRGYTVNKYATKAQGGMVAVKPEILARALGT